MSTLIQRLNAATAKTQTINLGALSRGLVERFRPALTGSAPEAAEGLAAYAAVTVEHRGNWAVVSLSIEGGRTLVTLYCCFAAEVRSAVMHEVRSACAQVGLPPAGEPTAGRFLYTVYPQPPITPEPVVEAIDRIEPYLYEALRQTVPPPEHSVAA